MLSDVSYAGKKLGVRIRKTLKIKNIYQDIFWLVVPLSKQR